ALRVVLRVALRAPPLRDAAFRATVLRVPFFAFDLEPRFAPVREPEVRLELLRDDFLVAMLYSGTLVESAHVNPSKNRAQMYNAQEFFVQSVHIFPCDNSKFTPIHPNECHLIIIQRAESRSLFGDSPASSHRAHRCSQRSRSALSPWSPGATRAIHRPPVPPLPPAQSPRPPRNRLLPTRTTPRTAPVCQPGTSRSSTTRT